MSRPSKVTPAKVRAVFRHTAKKLTSVQISEKVGLGASTVRKLRTGQLPLDLACMEAWKQTFGSQSPSDSVNNRSKPPSVRSNERGVTSHQTPATAPSKAQIFNASKKLAPEVSTTPEAVPVVPSNETKKEEPMLLPKQILSTQARHKFGLPFVSPFDGEVTCDAELFLNGEIRFVREAAWQAAIGGRFVAIIGESGSGKSTILDALKYRVRKGREPVVFIEPSVLGMEDSDTKGKTLKSAAIQTAIVMTLDALEGVAQSDEKRTRQVKRMLQESTSQGRSHLLVIEEAHSLPIPTLKHLKRLWEKCRVEGVGDKYHQSMLGVLLLGHPELEQKLNRFDVREVKQRCEPVRLPHLGDDLTAYLRFRAEAVGRKLDEFITPDGIDTLKTRLTVSGGDGKVMLLYPLNVNNWMVAALNTAAGLGAPRIDRDVVALV
jgi:type II secretory pathway predicted ATPase ExeA